jgi:hypothetical protein
MIAPGRCRTACRCARGWLTGFGGFPAFAVDISFLNKKGIRWRVEPTLALLAPARDVGWVGMSPRLRTALFACAPSTHRSLRP